MSSIKLMFVLYLIQIQPPTTIQEEHEEDDIIRNKAKRAPSKKKYRAPAPPSRYNRYLWLNHNSFQIYECVKSFKCKGLWLCRIACTSLYCAAFLEWASSAKAYLVLALCPHEVIDKATYIRIIHTQYGIHSVDCSTVLSVAASMCT